MHHQRVESRVVPQVILGGYHHESLSKHEFQTESKNECYCEPPGAPLDAPFPHLDQEYKVSEKTKCNQQEVLLICVVFEVLVVRVKCVVRYVYHAVDLFQCHQSAVQRADKHCQNSCHNPGFESVLTTLSLKDKHINIINKRQLTASAKISVLALVLSFSSIDLY